MILFTGVVNNDNSNNTKKKKKKNNNNINNIRLAFDKLYYHDY